MENVLAHPVQPAYFSKVNEHHVILDNIIHCPWVKISLTSIIVEKIQLPYYLLKNFAHEIRNWTPYVIITLINFILLYLHASLKTIATWKYI